jgi:hypothetical protein
LITEAIIFSIILWEYKGLNISLVASGNELNLKSIMVEDEGIYFVG